MKSYLFLALAIVFETIGTTALAASEQFTKTTPIVVMIVAYVACFYFLGLALKTIPTGVAYAIWSGVGIVLITLIGVAAFKQIPDIPAIIGMALIVAGVAIINLFSKTLAH
ncbi:MAG: QacE family quaternary ammonium compound efflux SMR transporter [Helicobacteraceae bacterium]|jgi:small multidrug resistance pump|nr:QacE family quaternary ammonium compound efflux SMR transporter [Helicobacteraceae bacterium]